jgi:hypothetical protein
LDDLTEKFHGWRAVGLSLHWLRLVTKPVHGIPAIHEEREKEREKRRGRKREGEKREGEKEREKTRGRKGVEYPPTKMNPE